MKNEIVNMLMTKLKATFGGAGRPGMKQMRELVMQLSHEYPEMFKTREGMYLYYLCIQKKMLC